MKWDNQAVARTISENSCAHQGHWLYMLNTHTPHSGALTTSLYSTLKGNFHLTRLNPEKFVKRWKVCKRNVTEGGSWGFGDWNPNHAKACLLSNIRKRTLPCSKLRKCKESHSIFKVFLFEKFQTPTKEWDEELPRTHYSSSTMIKLWATLFPLPSHLHPVLHLSIPLKQSWLDFMCNNSVYISKNSLKSSDTSKNK